MRGKMAAGVRASWEAKVSAIGNRVEVEDGHTESVRGRCGLRRRGRMVAGTWEDFDSGGLKTADSAASSGGMEYDGGDRPQPRLDRMRGAGMAATVSGRLRPQLLDWKFTVLRHNTIRGAGWARRCECGTCLLGKLDPGAPGDVVTESRFRSPGGGLAAGNLFVMMKFGGTSVEGRHSDQEAGIVRGRAREGDHPVVVVSAHGQSKESVIALPTRRSGGGSRRGVDSAQRRTGGYRHQTRRGPDDCGSDGHPGRGVWID